MPASITSKPPADMPADSAEARKSPETRVSRPTSARRRPSGWSSCVPASPSTRTAASPRSSASRAVKSLLASPRTPSVPNMFGIMKFHSLYRVTRTIVVAALHPKHQPNEKPPRNLRRGSISEANHRINRGNTPLNNPQRSKTTNQSKIHPAHSLSAKQNLEPIEDAPH